MTLAEAFRHQARSNANLGSPFTARILTLLADRIAPGSPVQDRMQAFTGDLGPSGHSVPLRLLGGLHARVLTGQDPDLAALYPPNPAPDDATLGAMLDRLLASDDETLLTWLDNPPQTNEVRRAVVMILAGHWLAARHGLPFKLSELGASAGLNLMWDRFSLALPDATYGPQNSPVTLSPDVTGPLPTPGAITVTDRRGVDLNPLDPRDPDDALRLLSYLWADQPERMDRTRAAIALAEAHMDRGDAAQWLEARLAEPHPGALHLVTHTIVWQYFPDETQSRCLAALEAAGARATPDAPLARLSMEADGAKDSAAVTLTTWPGGNTVTLGRVDFHGRWLDWAPPSAA